MGGLQRRDRHGKRAAGLVAFAVQQWHEIEYRFALLGIHEPDEVEYGRFCRLLLASLHEGLTAEQRCDIDEALRAAAAGDDDEPKQPVHPGAHQALGLTASAEYRRVMTDPRSTPEQRARVREREMQRLAAERRRRER